MLTDKHCKNAFCASEKKRLRFTDSGGLYLEGSPAGSKRWFCKLYSDGKEGRMAFGSYPRVGLADARRARDRVKLQKSLGVNPIQARRIERLKASNPAGDSFKGVALEWFAKQASQLSQGHADRALRQFERDLFPWIGSRHVREVEPVELLATLRKVKARSAIETAHRVLMLARQVWRYAIATAPADRDVTEGLKDALTPYRGTQFGAITDRVVSFQHEQHSHAQQ
jgi:Arm DNA-binding domain